MNRLLKKLKDSLGSVKRGSGLLLITIKLLSRELELLVT